MKTKLILFIFCICTSFLSSQDSISILKDKPDGIVKGYHLGIVQPIFSIKDGQTKSFFDYDVYTIGFPIGISLNTPGKVIIDLEMVPFISPVLDQRENFEVHLLYHPGILVPLGNGFTFGFRLAFETGQGQFGFTPLINKSFSCGKGIRYFIELVAPGRFGPNETSGYTQVFGIHTGIAL